MKALISPLDHVYANDGTLLGYRVAQVEENEFEISEPFFWVDCAEGCIADLWYYKDGELFPKPANEIEQ